MLLFFAVVVTIVQSTLLHFGVLAFFFQVRFVVVGNIIFYNIFFLQFNFENSLVMFKVKSHVLFDCSTVRSFVWLLEIFCTICFFVFFVVSNRFKQFFEFKFGFRFEFGFELGFGAIICKVPMVIVCVFVCKFSN